MSLPATRPALLRFVSFCVAGLIVLTGAGCGGHSSKTTSPLSDQDRVTLDGYEKIRVALADDDVLGARAAGNELAGILKPTDPKAAPSQLLESVQSVAAAPSLDRARQYFRGLSEILIPKVDGVEGYYIVNCSMPSAGPWIQRSRDVDNPYFGKVMHGIGEIKK